MMSSPQSEKEAEAESQGQRAGACAEACAKCMLLRRMNDGKATAPLSSPMENFEVDFTCVKLAL